MAYDTMYYKASNLDVEIQHIINKEIFNDCWIKSFEFKPADVPFLIVHATRTTLIEDFWPVDSSFRRRK